MDILIGFIIFLGKEKMTKYYIYILSTLLFFTGCCNNLDILDTVNISPDIFPDYKTVTVPPNIAPLNFRVEGDLQNIYAVFKYQGEQFQVKAKNYQIRIPERKWRKLVESATGDSIEVTVSHLNEEKKRVAMKPFHIKVAPERIDKYLIYRLIEPGYELWNKMGIYQRNLETFEQSAIIENSLTDNNCMNCHSFCMQNSEQMVFHMRGKNAGTYLIDGTKLEKLDTKTDYTISSLVYPTWHPSGKFIAFSVNDTKQGFHTIDPNRIEVYDNKSDIVVYDIKNHEIITTENIFSPSAFENFPVFSPNGSKLYFCSADSVEMPKDFQSVKYSLCSIDFDADNGKFNTKVDTLYNAHKTGNSVSFPRISPDGKYLIYAKGNYGGFYIWHKEADLHMINLETMEDYPLTAVNSEDAESYHSWSSNSKWIVFSSRRIDGLYTHTFIAYINAEGKAEKSFVLPQQDCNYYDNSMLSFNVPELIKEKVNTSPYSISQKAKNDVGINISFKME